MTKGEGSGNIPGDAKSRMDRVLRLHEEIDTIKEMIREVYGEEKDAGGDKTAMGAAVSIIRKRAKDNEKYDNAQGMVDLYLVAFSGASHTHAYARAEITHPQSAPRSESDLTDAHKPSSGQVADIQPETANEAAGIRPVPSMSEQTAPAPVQRSDAGNSAKPSGVTVVGTESGTVAAFTHRPLRPYCQNPGNSCGGMGKKHCWKCQQAHDEAGAA